MIDAGGLTAALRRGYGSAAGGCQRAGTDSYLPIKPRELASSRRRAARRRMGRAASSTTRLGRVPLDDSSGRQRAVLRVPFGLWPMPPRASVGAACVDWAWLALPGSARVLATVTDAHSAAGAGMTDDLIGSSTAALLPPCDDSILGCALRCLASIDTHQQSSRSVTGTHPTLRPAQTSSQQARSRTHRLIAESLDSAAIWLPRSPLRTVNRTGRAGGGPFLYFCLCFASSRVSNSQSGQRPRRGRCCPTSRDEKLADSRRSPLSVYSNASHISRICELQ